MTRILGSTSLVTFENGNLLSQTKYKAWGEVRHQSGPSLTGYTYTGQYSYTQDFGLMFYNARWYDPALGRFAQADSIVPPGVQGLDRYAYVNNSPMNYTDPSGHICVESDGDSDVGMAGNCHGGSNPKFKPELQGPKWNPKFRNTNNQNQGSGGGGIISPILPGSACTVNSCFTPIRMAYIEKDYYSYKGSLYPIIGLGVDIGGMIVDGASIALSIGFSVPGVLVSTKAQLIMSTIEFTWSAYMQAQNQYEPIYDYGSNLLDSSAARYTDSQESVPLVGFTASLYSAYNNMQVISYGFERHSTIISTVRPRTTSQQGNSMPISQWGAPAPPYQWGN